MTDDLDKAIERAIKAYGVPEVFFRNGALNHDYEGHLAATIAEIKRAIGEMGLFVGSMAPLLAEIERDRAQIAVLTRENMEMLTKLETLKAPEPSDMALNDAARGSNNIEKLRAAYAIDVVSLIAERDSLAAEVERLTDDNEDLKSTWPEWAKTILKMIRSESGNDGFCDDDGIDIPDELEEQFGYFRAEAERLTKERNEARRIQFEHFDEIKRAQGIVDNLRSRLEGAIHHAEKREKLIGELAERAEAAESSLAASWRQVETLKDALHRLSELTPNVANAKDARGLHLTAKAIADAALDAPQPDPRDGYERTVLDAALNEAYATEIKPGQRDAVIAEAVECSDCPPVGYPTDKTRCAPCPRAALAQLDAPLAEEAPPIAVDYTNWRGERRIRNILPLRPFHGSNEWHKEPQWLLEAIDPEDGKTKTFAFAGIHGFGDLSAVAAARETIAKLREALECAGRQIADGNTVLATATIYDALTKIDASPTYFEAFAKGIIE